MSSTYKSGATQSFNPNTRTGLNPLLRWLWDLLSFFSAEEITVPTDFYSQVYEVNSVLTSDTSGIVNSVLDFAIHSALVDYMIETSNATLTKTLNEWTKSINIDLIGKVPVGLQSLAKEYFRERWKGSSLLLLRTQWNNVDGFNLPTRMWFVGGENIEVSDANDNRVIGEEIYKLKLAKNKVKLLPATENELIFVQKPFDSWSALYPTPFLIQRGIYKNLKLFDLINKKGERIIGKALEYMLLMKKGTEQMAMSNNPDFIYSDEDLKKVRDNFKTFMDNNKTVPGTPTHVTNFDTELEHLIPDYSKAIKDELYTPIQKRLLAGLGLIEIVEGTTTTRREGILNPKPFIEEIDAGIADFKVLLNDIVQVIIDKNSKSHRKYFASDIKIYASPVKTFITDEIRNHIRSMYDRGVISKQTYIEVAGESVYFDIEVQRRKDEATEKIDDVLYPPVITNQEQHPDAKTNVKVVAPKNENIPLDKQGLEKKNYKGEVFEEAPYKENKDLPEQVKVLPSEAQDLWRRVFNESYPKGEDYARKVAWAVIKKTFKKNKDGDWVKKTKTKGEDGEWIDLENASIDEIFSEITQLQEMELRDKQIQIANKLLKEEN